MQIKRLVTMAAIAATFSVGIASAQRGGRGGGIPAPLKLTISAFPDGGMVAAANGCVGGKNANLSPAIQWSGAPDGTMSYAVILHDTDLQLGAEDVLHWAIFNIRGSATGLPEGVPSKSPLDDGSVQLQNVGRSTGYFNPCPPPPTTHHYTFEVFALDAKLDPAIASRADLVKAMTGHVKAKGTYFGTYHQ